MLCACAAPRPKPKPPVAAVQPPARHVPQLIGTITLVNSSLHFVLVDVRAFEYPTVGIALESFADGKETAILTVSPEKNRPFIIADIVKGMPNRGDLVYE